MTRRKVPTRDRILDVLRRRGPLTASELARRFRISSMAVRQHLATLAREGFVRAGEERPSRGRPARAFDLTPAGRGWFPDRSGTLALEVLEELESVAGRKAVVRALERRARRVAGEYAAAIGKGSLKSRLRVLATLRDAEGYCCTTEGGGNGVPEIVERHCAVSSLAKRWPEVCRIEEEVFGRALGRTVRRKEHLLRGGTCCRYEVSEV